jgi:hypothetical protein
MVMPTTPPPQLPVVLRGSVVTRRRRCGKPNCRCADGVNLHESPALSYSVRGRTRILLLEEADVASVRAAVDRYRALCRYRHNARYADSRVMPRSGWVGWSGAGIGWSSSA